MQLKRSRAWAVVLGLAASTVACSFVLTRTEGQCNTHSDCAARGGEFLNSVCTDSHVCVPIAVDASTPVVDAGPCTKNSDCVGSLGLSVCRNQQCAALAPSDLAGVRCVSSNLGQTTDGALLIGMLADLDHAGTQEDAIDLARSASVAIADLNSVGSSGSVSALPGVVGVVCDEFSQSSIDYLLGTLRARVVIGPTQTQNLATALKKTRAAQAVLLSPRADDPNADGPSGDGTFFSIRPNRARQLSYFENAVAKVVSLAKLTSPKIALAVGSDASTKTFADRLSSDGGAPFIRIDYAAVGESGFQEGYQNTLVAPLVAAEPNLIVAASSVDAWDVIIQKVEKAWHTGVPRPTYLLEDKSSVVERQISIIEADCACDLHSRVIGLTPLHDPRVYQAFVDDYRAAKTASPAYGAEFAYDALYASVYASLRGAAVGHVDPNAVTTTLFRDGLMAVTGPDGTPERVGAADVADIVRSLGAAKIALVGASGPLDFAGNATPLSDGRLYCMSNSRFCDSTVAFNAKTGAEYSVAKDPACSCFQ